MKWILAGFLIVAISSCQKETDLSASKLIPATNSPNDFPAVIEPEDNQYSTERWELGKKLFFDRRLSRDSTISCASCHDPSLAFSDDQMTSTGVGGLTGTRNAPTLANVAYHPYLTREGGVPTLEMQVLIPIQEHNEFDFNIIEIVKRLKNDAVYQEMSLKAYERKFDHFVITRSIACFERTLISNNSAYDKYQSQGHMNAMSTEAIRGMDLFFSPATNCSSCHGGFNFTNYAFENNGLYENYEDAGRFRLTNFMGDMNLFKVPSLRNVAFTGPYMHDGSITSLTEVVEHYNSGGASHPQKNELIRPLNLTDREKQDLVAFLHSLSDYKFVENPLYHEP